MRATVTDRRDIYDVIVWHSADVTIYVFLHSTNSILKVFTWPQQGSDVFIRAETIH